MSGGLQHSRPYCREDAFHRFHDPVVEGVHGACCLMLANRSYNERLNAWRFDFDIDHDVTIDCIEHRGKTRDCDALIELEFPEFRQRQIDDATGRHAWRIYECIVMYDDCPILRAVHI